MIEKQMLIWQWCEMVWPAPADCGLYSCAAGLRTVSDDAVTMTTVVRSNNTHFHCSFSSTGRNVEP